MTVFDVTVIAQDAEIYAIETVIADDEQTARELVEENLDPHEQVAAVEIAR